MARYRGLVYETIFALLYGLGLRVGEVVRLTLADADFSRDLLFIRETKFCKSRIVPLGPNLARRLKRYVDATTRQQCCTRTAAVLFHQARLHSRGDNQPNFSQLFYPNFNYAFHQAYPRPDSMI